MATAARVTARSYAGLKRPRELEHDSQAYDAYLHAADRLRGQGSRVDRVVLDYELKRDYQKWLHENDSERDDYDGHPDRDQDEIRHWAMDHDLPYFDDQVHFPDLRIEYEDRDGRHRHEDIDQPLYRATGEPHNRNRKPVPASRVVERLMLLDAVLSHPEIDWLATTADKIAYLSSAPGSDEIQWPRQTVAGAVRYFPDHLPIGVSPTRRVVVLFLATTPIADDLKALVRRHAALLRTLPDWTVRLVMAPRVAAVRSSLEAAVRDQLATTESPATRDALANGAGRIESEVLPHSYRHLSPLTSLVRPRVKGVEKGEHVGEHTLAHPQPRRVEREDDDPAGKARDWRGAADAH